MTSTSATTKPAAAEEDEEDDSETAEAGAAPAKPQLNLDPQTEELFRFIDTLKKLKESEDLEKAGGPAVVQAHSGGGLTTVALFVVVLFALGVFAYGAYVWVSNQDHTITDPQIMMTKARDAFRDKRYDATIFWAEQVLAKEQESKALVPDAVLLLVKSNMAMDKIKAAGALVDRWNSKFESDISADKRGEFHHLEGEQFKKLERMNPGQQFLEAYKSDPKNFLRLKDKFSYIQCLLSEPNKDLASQMKLLDELDAEVADNTTAQPKEKSDLQDQIKNWRKVLNQLKG